MKKVLSIVLSIAMVICLMPAMAFAGTATASQAAAAYNDTEGTACEGAVNVLSALGVVSGYEDGSYKPEQVVTRAEMAKLIITALGVDDYAKATVSQFTDMSGASWAIPYVEYAANLGIVNGYGGGLFGPSDTVTYEQALTMVVRALGYTDEAKEMNGTWPAIYVQKASALGLLEDVENGGTIGANRGDVAIILYNALEVAEVYVDNDGQTCNKKGAAGTNTVSMMTTLNKSGTSQYEVISSQAADTALLDIRQYVGAAAKVTKDKNGDILAVGDIKTTFMTGDVSSDAKKFTVDDVDYDITGVEFVGVDASTGGSSGTTAVYIQNGLTSTSTVSAASSIQGRNNVTIAAKVSGKTIKEVYSAAVWTVTAASQVEDSDLTKVVSGCKLLGKEFNKNDDLEPDTATFVLNGVASLNDIKEDNIVYVYTNGTANGDKIRRVDVGTEVVTGEITKVSSSKVTIDGTAYKFAIDAAATGSGDDRLNAPVSVSTWSAGDTVKVYLDYEGRIFDGDLEEAGGTNYAVVYSKSTTAQPSSSATESDAKIQLVTADGTVSVFDVNGEKFTTSVSDHKSTAWTSLAAGDIVKYELNSDNKVTRIYDVTDTGITGNKLSALIVSSNYITKAGYLDSTAIADNATIFTLPTTGTPAAWDFSDSDDASVTTLAAVCDSTPARVAAVKNDKGKIVAMLVSDEATSDDTYGIVTSSYSIKDSSYGADLYIGSEEKKDIETDSSVAESQNSSMAVTLYKIVNAVSGKYKLTPVTLKATAFDTATAKALVKFENGYIVKDQATDLYDSARAVYSGGNLTLYEDAVIYVYDKSDEEWTLGSKSDITSDDNYTINFYSTSTDTKDDEYGLVDYVIIYRA